MNDAIAFIGGGNMARSLVGGLVARGRDPASIRVAEPVPPLRDALRHDFGVQVFDDGPDLALGLVCERVQLVEVGHDARLRRSTPALSRASARRAVRMASISVASYPSRASA